MGFPDDFVIPVSDTQAYRLFGNIVLMPLIQEVANNVMPFVLSRFSMNQKGVINGE